jgi:preprotein translocase subunit SecD
MNRPTFSDRLLGLSQAPTRPPNTYPVFGYIMIFGVLLLGLLYAAPNFFPPDYALQIRSEKSDTLVDQSVLDAATKVIADAGIEIRGTELAGKDALIRLTSNEDQLRARELVHGVLNADEQRYVVALNLAATTPQWMREIGAKPMSYGLDLSGGVHFLLEVDMDKAMADRMVTEEDNIRRILVDKKLRYVPGAKWVDGTRIQIGFIDAATRDAAKAEIEKELRDYLILERDVNGRPGLVMTLKEAVLREIEDYAVEQNLVSLRNRVNEIGVSEPLVQKLGRTRIVVDLPGIQDSADAKRILNKFANLEFRLVHVPGRAVPTERWQYEGREVVLERRNIVTGDRVTNAKQDYDENGLPQVSIRLDSAGGDRMHDATKDNVGNQMAVIYKELVPRTRTVMKDGQPVVERFTEEQAKVINVATIRSALGYSFRITGIGLGEARDLALQLRAGALAAPMFIVEERTIGATLGEENIKQGTEAAIIGLIAVVIFMVIAYKVFGLLADIALTFNVVLLVALMSILGATLTMPGIAGIILTIGMAVDANIIIFARIQEELDRRGIQGAIVAGFDRAFLTILDANITTFFIAVICFAMGSGPIKGFAVTLAIGIVTSVFTAVTVTRALVNLTHGGRNLKKIYI